MVVWEVRLAGHGHRLLSVEDAYPALVLFPERPQPSDGIRPGEGEQTPDALRLHLVDGIIVVLAPDDVAVVWRIDALIADDG